MSANRRAAVVAAEALGGILCWVFGSSFGWHIKDTQDWTTRAALLVACIALESLGLWLFTNSRGRYERRKGYAWGREDALAGAVKFLQENSKLSIEVVDLRPGKPKAPEKAPN